MDVLIAASGENGADDDSGSPGVYFTRRAFWRSLQNRHIRLAVAFHLYSTRHGTNVYRGTAIVGVEGLEILVMHSHVHRAGQMGKEGDAR